MYYREELFRGYNKVDIQKDLVSKTKDLKDNEILKQQSQTMNGIQKLFNHFIEQDQNLDILSESIRRQKDIGLLISQELDTHLEILEDTEYQINYTETRLGTADRNLRKMLKKAKTNSKTFVSIFIGKISFIMLVLSVIMILIIFGKILF